jgi:hypothetical protein
LSKIKHEIPTPVADSWDREFGRSCWRNDKDVTDRVARSLVNAMREANLDGLSLWDTMRNGSDYWRPGNLLLKVANIIRASTPGAEISYSRADELCPASELLEQFDADSSMTFGQYAEDYASFLRNQGGVETAALHLLCCPRLGSGWEAMRCLVRNM